MTARNFCGVGSHRVTVLVDGYCSLAVRVGASKISPYAAALAVQIKRVLPREMNSSLFHTPPPCPIPALLSLAPANGMRFG